MPRGHPKGPSHLQFSFLSLHISSPKLLGLFLISSIPLIFDISTDQEQFTVSTILLLLYRGLTGADTVSIPGMVPGMGLEPFYTGDPHHVLASQLLPILQLQIYFYVKANLEE